MTARLLQAPHVPQQPRVPCLPALHRPHSGCCHCRPPSPLPTALCPQDVQFLGRGLGAQRGIRCTPRCGHSARAGQAGFMGLIYGLPDRRRGAIKPGRRGSAAPARLHGCCRFLSIQARGPGPDGWFCRDFRGMGWSPRLCRAPDHAHPSPRDCQQRAQETVACRSHLSPPGPASPGAPGGPCCTTATALSVGSWPVLEGPPFPAASLRAWADSSRVKLPAVQSHRAPVPPQPWSPPPHQEVPAPRDAGPCPLRPTLRPTLLPPGDRG